MNSFHSGLNVYAEKPKALLYPDRNDPGFILALAYALSLLSLCFRIMLHLLSVFSLTLGIPPLLADTAPLSPSGEGIEAVSPIETSLPVPFINVAPDPPLLATPTETLLPLIIPPHPPPTEVPALVIPIAPPDVPLTSIIDLNPIPPLSPSPTPTPTHIGPPPRAAWTAPANFSDLGSFKVQKFASGKSNLQFVNGIPASASSPLPQLLPTALPFLLPPLLGSTPVDQPSQSWDNSSTAIQLLYPATSSNPAGNPVGGAEIYFSPLSLSTANNVTLVYSVFFPFNFDWVLGGKLPGIYGGHTGCSGGNDALSCFSTRMMWRQWGAGELYLYAPKDKQNPSLCKTPPQSVCNDDFGFSIGRGSFHFAAGSWTKIQQTVGLNTPGQQDGTFILYVNDKLIMNLTQIFYRDVSSTAGGGAGQKRDTAETVQGLVGGLGGILPPLLGPVGSIIAPSATASKPAGDGGGDGQTHTSTTKTALAPAKTTSSSARPAPSPQPPAKFSGVFFSTFFGGHGEQWATSRDQFTWFKDFALEIIV